MSWETENWARQQRTGDPVTKAVLVGIANWMNPEGQPCRVSMRRLAEEVEISVRTAQRHVQQLERMGFVVKEAAKRDDGGTGWNLFSFPTYRQPGVSTTEPARRVAPIKPQGPQNRRNRGASPHDKLTRGKDDNLTPTPMTDCHPSTTDCQVGTPDCQGVHDTHVRGEILKGSTKTPLSPPEGGADAVSSKRDPKSRLPDDWEPVPIAELPPAARAKASQWPAGAYAAEAETFRATARSESGRAGYKRDWPEAWISHINRSTVRVMAEARAGVKHAPVAPTSAAPAEPLRSLDTSTEGKAAQEIRKRLVKTVEASVRTGFFDRCRFDVRGDTLTIATPSEFVFNYLRDGFETEAHRAMNSVLGPDADLRWSIDRAD